MTTSPFAIALDIGGTKIAAAVVRPDGSVHHRVQVTTPAGDGEVVWAAVAGAVVAVVDQVDIDGCMGVGVATAGPIDLVAGTVSPVNIPGWRGFPLVRQLEGLVPAISGRPVRVAGDAVCMAMGEHWRGAGQGCDDMVGMVVSTGVGGGLIIGGRPLVGPSGNAGHLGHISVDLEGPPCACGGVGCVEAIASGRSIAAWAVANGFHATDSGSDSGSDGPGDGPGGELTAIDVADAARAGDPVALAAFERAGRAIGSMLAGTATVLDVHVAVIGGGVANAGELLFAPIRRSIERYAGLAYARSFELRRAALGGDAGLVGAAALVLHAS